MSERGKRDAKVDMTPNDRVVVHPLVCRSFATGKKKKMMMIIMMMMAMAMTMAMVVTIIIVVFG